jgi:hypothetical protein
MRTAQGYPAQARVRVYSFTTLKHEDKYFDTYEEAVAFCVRVSHVETLFHDPIAVVEVQR